MPRRLARPRRAGQDHRALAVGAARSGRTAAAAPRPVRRPVVVLQQGHYKRKRKESWLSELFD
ncbi:hypothetical protein [Nocardioides sp. TF02-7]|uniref:hypothetical protein n=1 Tax=Nocardioides sp. TF02-7 TaxID=2917724 RepID=UPI001F05D9A2|nr:hypothetical protein [Nocardioides sp. TF02-7]UMG91382.1 hypothetical protein MF408_14640 [Nocardioides sp. TF02-7]